MVILLTNQNANGNGDPKGFQGNGTLVLYGTFDGATVKLQIKAKDGTWVDINNGSFTAAYADNFTLGGKCTLRAVVSDAGASTDISGEIQ